MQHWQLLDLLAWAGLLAFGVSGALVAVQKRFDLVGIIVLTGVTAIGGGAIRDVLVGSLPAGSLRNEPVLWLVFLVALLAWRFSHRLGRLERLIYYLDTIGLGLFAALGAERALTFGLGFWGCVFVGTVSGVGGGVLRDVLAGEIPGIFYRNRDLYASAASGGAALVFLIYTFIPAYSALAEVLGALVTIALRLSSRWLGLQLPTAR
ncbi:MAG: TRIC cation channel family protein [Meiothermus sp.]|uniref:trimeric intracellular cation channel family protein n=1 Tax=Meiothermus sp. TaxID=1955249 RepID=UPI0028CCCBDA|nr:TRIC cation channel family protein [Meiothermus sp.]MDT7919802.1 TRIC cation channel family protein [Meiothermus sp.]